MFSKLSGLLSKKFQRKDDLSKQLEIVQVLDLYRAKTKKLYADAKTVPISLKNKVLTVQAASSSHASELRLHESIILKEINQQLGKEVLKRVIYRI